MWNQFNLNSNKMNPNSNPNWMGNQTKSLFADLSVFKLIKGQQVWIVIQTWTWTWLSKIHRPWLCCWDSVWIDLTTTTWHHILLMWWTLLLKLACEPLCHMYSKWQPLCYFPNSYELTLTHDLTTQWHWNHAQHLLYVWFYCMVVYDCSFLTLDCMESEEFCEFEESSIPGKYHFDHDT